MKPLILDFAENPELIDLDISILEYSDELNLTVLKSTKEIAIEKVCMETETFTKSVGEGTDQDKDLVHSKTPVITEVFDSDPSIQNLLTHLMETTTYTFANREETDTDKDISKIRQLMDTRTITEYKGEATDSDN